MTKKDELAARAAGLAARPVVAGKPTASRGHAPRTAPIRITADLAPQSYRALLAYCADLAEEIGQAKVPHVEVIRALISELEVNPGLQRSVRRAIVNGMRK